MELRGANSTWCVECRKHKSQCECDPIQNIYLVEYKLLVDTGVFPTWCHERVRVISYDEWLARGEVNKWLLETDYIWYNTKEGPVEHEIPSGARDVTIGTVILYAKDVGDMLKQCPLPTILPYED